MAEKNEVDPNLIVAFVFVGLATGGLPLLVAYIVGWIVFPLRWGKGRRGPTHWNYQRLERPGPSLPRLSLRDSMSEAAWNSVEGSSSRTASRSLANPLSVVNQIPRPCNGVIVKSGV